VSSLNRTITYIVYALITLGVIGFFSRLVTNPSGLIMNFVFIALIVGVIYFVYNRLSIGKMKNKGQLAFKKAVRLSKKRQKTKLASAKSKRDNIARFQHGTTKKNRIRKKSDVQLTVIEGKKNKKKNRASL
jgi:membrane-bound ClpP family serine protease